MPEPSFNLCDRLGAEFLARSLVHHQAALGRKIRPFWSEQAPRLELPCAVHPRASPIGPLPTKQLARPSLSSRCQATQNAGDCASHSRDPQSVVCMDVSHCVGRRYERQVKVRGETTPERMRGVRVVGPACGCGCCCCFAKGLLLGRSKNRGEKRRKRWKGDKMGKGPQGGRSMGRCCWCY